MKGEESAGVRAVICDVYGTLLQVGPPRVDGAAMWEAGCREMGMPSIPLPEFNASCAARIASENALSRAEGEPYPDQDWIEIVLQEWPELHSLSVKAMVELCRLHARCCRSCTALPGATQTLESLRKAGVIVGIASNAQTYTISELHGAGFVFADFDDKLVFLSGAHGFAKPSPRVFALLTEKLASLGIAPQETLMVGDSIQNDILPASEAGWQTWLIDPVKPGRSWEFLAERLARVR